MIRILVTGAGSYIGTSLMRWLEQWTEEYFYESVDMVGVMWKQKDFSQFDVVFHVAGIAHISADPKMEALYYKVNRDIAIETAQKAKAEGVKQFVFMSSINVYGDSSPIHQKKVIDKNMVPCPANFYGNSKLQAEAGILALMDEHFKVAIVRSPMVYGRGSKGNYPKLSKFARYLPLFPDVDNERSMLYTDHLCEFIRLLIKNEESGIFHPQNREYVQTTKLVKLIAEVHGKEIRLTKVFNPLLRFIGRFTGVVQKVFGNLVYEKSLSEYKEEYRVMDLRDSIRATEKDTESMPQLPGKWTPQSPGTPILMPVSESLHSDFLVSVIIPAYNCEKYIEQCMDSVIHQTYQNWEMLIVDDHSTDFTKELIEKYMEMEPRIKLYTQPVNMGAAAARNKALELSKGRFIAFIDADDTWKPEKLERQLSFMLKYHYGFTFTAYDIMSDSPVRQKKIFYVPEKINYKQYLRNTTIGCLTVVIDKEVLGEIRVETGQLEDVLTWMKYLKKGHIAYGLNENLASYRVVKNSASNNKFRNAKRYFMCLRKQQNLSLPQCVYCQIGYMYRATKKRLLRASAGGNG